MSKKIKNEQKKFLGETLNQYDKALDEAINQLDKKNREQNHKISSLVNSFDNEYLEKDIEGNMTTLENSKDGMVIINEIQGNTEVNYCKDGEKELILNGDIDTQGESFVTITEGVDGGLVDVSLEGNTEVNLSKTKDPVLVTREFDDINCNAGKLQYTIDDVTTINDEPGKVDIDRIVGDTMMNHAVNGSEELILNAHIDKSGDNNITLNGVTSEGGKVDVALEGNTLVNVSKTKDDYITPSIEDKVDKGSVISLPEVSEGLIHIDEIEGNTMVNYCTDGTKELTLNGDIDVEGTFVTTTEGVDNGLVDVTLEGNTLVNLCQNKGVGNNGKLYGTSGIGTIEYIEIENGCKYITNSNTESHITVRMGSHTVIAPNKTYTLVFEIEKNTLNFAYTGITICGIFDSYFGREENRILHDIDFETTVGVKKISFTTPSDISMYDGFGYGFPYIVTTEPGMEFVIKNTMLLEGDWTDKEIPQYFEGMKSVGQDDENGHKIEILSSNGNYANTENTKQSFPYSSDGITFSKNNLIYNIQGSTSSYPYVRAIEVGKLEPNTRYSFTCKLEGTGLVDLRLISRKHDDELVIISPGSTFTTPFDMRDDWGIDIATSPSENINKTVSEIMIKKVENTMTYKPYQSNKKEILLNEPLRSLPNGTKDRFVKIGGKWFIERNCGSYTFDGSDDERWWKPFDSVYRYDMRLHKDTNESLGDLICNNRLITTYINYDNINYDNYIYSTTDGLSIIKFNSDVNSVKQELKNNPIEIVYQLRDTIYEPLEIESTLNTYNDTTHLSNNSIIPCNMKIQNTGYNAIIKPSTLYTVALDTNKSGTIGINLGGAKVTTTNNVATITTPKTLTDDSLRLYGKGIKGSRVRLLEGDKTNWIPSYFEGMKSSFEDKIQDDGSYKMGVLMNNGNLFRLEDLKCSTEYDSSAELIDNGFKIRSGMSSSWGDIASIELNVKPNTIYTFGISQKVVTNAYSDHEPIWGVGYTFIRDYGGKILIEGKLQNNIRTYMRFNSGKNTKVRVTFTPAVDSPNQRGEYDFIDLDLRESEVDLEYIENKSNKVQLSSIEPLRGIGDVHDRIVFKDGKLMIERNFSTFTLNSKQNYYLSSGGWENKTDVCTFEGYIPTPTPILDNLIKHYADTVPSLAFHQQWEGSGSKGIEGISTHAQGGFSLSIKRSKLKTQDVDGLDEYLRENPITVVYQLAEPTYEEIPYDLQKIILESYNNGTLFIDTNIPPTKVSFNCFEEELTYLYPATSYTLQFVSDRVTTADITLGGTQLLAQSIVEGLNRISITTPETLANNKLVIEGAGAKIRDIVVTDTDRKFSYFEGMKSVGECEGNEIEVLSQNYQVLNTDTNGLVCHLKVGASTVTNDTMSDLSGNGNNATLYGASINENYLNFNGESDYATINRCVSDDFTISLKAEVISATGGVPGNNNQWYSYTGLVDSEYPSTANDFGLAITNEGYPCLGIGKPDITVRHKETCFNKLTTFTYTRNKTTGEMKLYIDGKHSATISSMNKNSLDANPLLYIGKSATRETAYANMKFYELKIYNKVLDESEIFKFNKQQLTHEPLRAVGDAKDRYVLIDGKWYIERNCGKAVLDGTNHTIKQRDTDISTKKRWMVYSDSSIKDVNEYNITIINNKYRSITANTSWLALEDGISQNSVGNAIHIYLERYSDGSDVSKQALISELQQNPVKLVYELATPIYEPINYNPLGVYSDVTHISTNSTIPCNLTIKNHGYNMVALKENTQYTLYVNKDTTNALTYRLGDYVEINSLSKFTFTTPSTLTDKTLRIDSKGVKVKDLMLIEGTPTNDSIGYFDGLKSSYECEQVTDENDENYGKYKVTAKVVGKNKLNINNVIKNGYFTTATILDNVLTVTGKWYASIPVSVKSYTNYRLSWTNLEGMNVAYVYDLDGKTNLGSTTFNSGNRTRVNVYFYCSTGTDRTSKYTNIQLEEGDTATEYEPYFESKQTIYLNSPLLKGDEIVWKDNKIQHYHKMKTIVLDGSDDENISIETTLTKDNTIGFKYYDDNIASVESYCDKFMYEFSFEDKEHHVNNPGWLCFLISKSKLQTQDSAGFKQWLQQNPTTVVYQLATPYYEEISDYPLKLNVIANSSLSTESTIQVTNISFNIYEETLPYLYPNTKYYITFNADVDRNNIIINLGGSHTVLDCKVGFNKVEITTPSDTTNLLTFSGTGVNIDHVKVTQQDIDGYFEGMKSVGECEDNVIEILSNNKNLIDPSKVVKDKRIDSKTGEVIDTSSYYALVDYVPIKPNMSLIYSATKVGTESNPINGTMFHFYDINKKHIYSCYLLSTGLLPSSVINGKTPNNAHYLRISYGINDGWGTSYETLLTGQLEYGTTKTDCILHQSNIQQLAHEPLRAVEDYRDRYVMVDGKWFIERNCKEVVFDGIDETWSMYSSTVPNSDLYYYYYYDNNIDSYKCKCDKFMCKNPDIGNLWNTEGEGIGYKIQANLSTSCFRVRINKSRGVTDVQTFRQWLANNPLIVIYPLASPIYEPIDYNPFEVYSDTTHITTNSLIPSNMVIKNHGYNCILKPSTKYTIVLNKPNGTISAKLGGSTKVDSTNSIFTITTPSTLNDNVLRLSGSGKVKDIMILEGDKTINTPSYFERIESVFEQEYDVEKGKYRVTAKVEGYGKESSIIFYIDEPLRGVEDSKDKAFIRDGKVIVERKCDSYTFDGSDDEEWILAFGGSWYIGSTTAFISYRHVEKVDLSNKFYCDNFILDGNFVKGDVEQIALNSGGVGKYACIRILNSKLATQDVNGFKQWLQHHPTTVVYKLAEPVYEEADCDLSKLVLENYENSSLIFESNIPVSANIKYSGEVPVVTQAKALSSKVDNTTFDINENIIPYMCDIDYRIVELQLMNGDTQGEGIELLGIGDIEILGNENVLFNNREDKKYNYSYDMLKRDILSQRYSREEYQYRLDRYLLANKISDEEYKELEGLLNNGE